MDVDLLRPGTVPLNPDTVFFFEFLLNPDLLEQHLNKSNPDPTPVELITKFINTILETTKIDVAKSADNEISDRADIETNSNEFKESKKILALRILSLKILAFLKWNLDFLIKKVPVKFQSILFQDLFYFVTGNEQRIEIPFSKDFSMSTESMSDQLQFSLILYHRWIIKLFVFRSIQIRYSKGFVFNTSHQYENAYLQFLNDEAVKLTLEAVLESVKFVEHILNSTNSPKIITYDTLIPLREHSDRIQHDWNMMADMNIFELHAQLHYDLGTFFFQQKNVENARKHFSNCSKSLKDISRNIEFDYLSFAEDSLNGYLSACDVSVISFDGREKSLTHKFLYYIYVEIENDAKVIEVLLADNRSKEIPITYRTNYELDLQAALVYNLIEGKNKLLTYVQVLNIVRNILEQNNVFTSNLIELLSENKDDTLEVLQLALSPFKDSDDLQKKLITFYLQELFIELNENQKLSNEIRSMEVIKHFVIKMDINLKSNIDTSFVDFNDISWTTFDSFKNEPEFIQERILNSVDFDEDVINARKMLKGSMNDIFASNDKPFVPVWRLVNESQLPSSLKSVISSLTNANNLKDLAHIFLLKSRKFLENKNYSKSKSAIVYLVNLIKKQDGSQVKKMLQLLEWEILLIDIIEMLECWVTSANVKDDISKRCKTCLNALKSDDLILRLEIADYSLMALLNLSDWDYIISLEKCKNHFEMTVVLSNVCIEFTMFKSNKKAYKEIWDLVLQIFSSTSATSGTKRFTSGTNLLTSQREAPTSSKCKKNFIDFIMKIRDVTCFNIILSLLGRIYNVLRDDSSLELCNEYLYIWPAVITNANSYNIQDVCEVLEISMKQALKYYPKKTQYIKLLADLSFLKGQSRTALRHYLIALIYCTDNFLQPIVKPQVDDYTIRRMIKCCLQLNNFIQVAVLCQFLDDVDYALAFKSLNDSKINGCSDAADQLYPFIWNNSILEYIINLHHKRGEGEKKLQALKTIGLLELNANNNEEIRKEAANIRKQNFLRVLVKEYVLCHEDQFFGNLLFRFFRSSAFSFAFFRILIRFRNFPF